MFRLANKRPLKFAGSWYEADAKKLAGQFDGFDSAAKIKIAPLANELKGQQILAIVAPHAGYTFSGQTAACSFLAAESKNIKRIFLLGPSHYRAFRGAAVTSDKSFATAFGELPVDTDVMSELKGSQFFQELSEVHRDEHSLEMQLAFIKRDFGNVKIVPILIGTLEDIAEARLIGGEIQALMKEGDLVVVSSDFTHYGPRYRYAPFESQKGDLGEMVKRLDMEAFSYLQKNDLAGFFSFYKRTDDTICGVYALTVLLAMLPESAQGHLIDYRTSRDSIVEDDKNSVSYLAIAFAGDKPWSAPVQNAESQETLSESDKLVLLKLARETLDHFVRSGSVPDIKSLTARADIQLDDRLKRPQGVFVTLFKVLPDHMPEKKGSTSGARDGKELRGCIGYIKPVKPLYQAVMDNAVAACSRDFRFEPVQVDELDQIEIEISVLTTPRKVASYNDIRVGVDGVLLYCQDKQSVFLPQVATEFGWDLNEMLSQLAAKAGLPAMAWKGPTARFETFQTISIEEKHSSEGSSKP